MEADMFYPFKFLHNDHDPFRPPHLRWLRAEYLVGHGRDPITEDDEATRLALVYLRQLQRTNEGDHAFHDGGLAAVAEAHHLFVVDQPLKRAEVQARILAGDEDAEIASRCGLSPGVVRVYHDLFFNVRKSLNCAAYVYGVVVGRKAHHGCTEDDREVLLMLHGYELGGPAVDEQLRYWRHPPVVPDRLDGLTMDQLRDLHARLQTRRVVLLRTVEIDEQTAPKFLLFQAGDRPAFSVGSESGQTAVVSAPVRSSVDWLAAGSTHPKPGFEALGEVPATPGLTSMRPTAA
jgi:hypothetical protein